MDPRRMETAFFVGLLALAVFFAWLVFQPYLGVIILAGTLAFVFRPVYRKLLTLLRYPSLSAILVVVIVTLIVFVPLGFFGFRIFGEATGLYTSLAAKGSLDLGATLTRFFQTNFPNLHLQPISLNFHDSIQQILSWLIGNLGFFFSGAAQIFFTAFLSLLGLFYFLRDGEQLKRRLSSIIPLSPEYADEIMGHLEAVLDSVVKGTLLMAVIQGVVAGFSFWIFHVPNPAFWGAVTVIATLVPIVGTWLVVVPAVAYLALTGQGSFALGLAIWSLIAVNLIYNLIAPQLMRRGADIHPYVILLSVLGGIAVFGPIGFIAGPLLVALLFSLLNLYPKFVAGKISENGKYHP